MARVVLLPRAPRTGRAVTLTLAVPVAPTGSLILTTDISSPDREDPTKWVTLTIERFLGAEWLPYRIFTFNGGVYFERDGLTRQERGGGVRGDDLTLLGGLLVRGSIYLHDRSRPPHDGDPVTVDIGVWGELIP